MCSASLFSACANGRIAWEERDGGGGGWEGKMVYNNCGTKHFHDRNIIQLTKEGMVYNNRSTLRFYDRNMLYT